MIKALPGGKALIIFDLLFLCYDEKKKMFRVESSHDVIANDGAGSGGEEVIRDERER